MIINLYTMLRFAARAAGIEESRFLMAIDGVSIIQPDGTKWNPLICSHQALELAAKLYIRLSFTPNAAYAYYVCGVTKEPYQVRQPKVAADRAPYNDVEAARLAILQVAAYVGEHMR